MKLTDAQLKVLAAADAAYHDGELDLVGGVAGDRGDTLADFIAIEISEVTEGETDPKQAALEAERAMRTAIRELIDVADALAALWADGARA